ncbi:MAG: hypothetical protein DRJ52_03155 [Thermoprotei archaeon]|nr:MAG: hypothetical protein DRJ52_03155 [Thermoprotei archaeon]
MRKVGSLDLSRRLHVLREAARSFCSRLVESRRDVVAVFVVGSVARGSIHEESDVDVCVLVNVGDMPRRELVRELGCEIDVVYVPLAMWEERLRREVGSMWEINVSNILDSLVLYDPYGLIERIKRELKVYPEEKRRENILYHFHLMGWHENSVKYHYSVKKYDIESIFSKLFVVEALRILFPLNSVYLKGDKYLFDQVNSLQAPSSYLENCFNLLWFKSQNIEHGEAAWIKNTVSEIMETMRKEILQRKLAPLDLIFK